MSALVSSFDPDGRADDARVERAAFAIFRTFIRDDANAGRRWENLKPRSRERWMREARAALEAASC